MKFKLTLIAALALLTCPATNCGVFSKLATSARVAFSQPTFSFKSFAPKATLFAGFNVYKFFKPTVVHAEQRPCYEGSCWDHEEVEEVMKKMDKESRNWKLTREEMDEEVRALRKKKEAEIAQYKREKLTQEDIRRILSTYCSSDYKRDAKDFRYGKASVRCITTLANMRNFLERAVEDRDKRKENWEEARKINIMLKEMDETLRVSKK